ncbi:phage tail tape measure protein [Thermoanaerobacterium thermosulfurigenes]|uniref:phage tail tape measure protein n=1 Tax=Thermoanaerobacterium thermosulfurigenes TaxID=33950 RepID=UPI003EF95815
MAEELGNLSVKISMDSTGFQQGISNISRSLRVVQSDMKAQLAQFSDNQKGLDALKVKYDGLSQQIDLQKQKIETLTQAYQKSVQDKGEDATATQNLVIKLNNARAELAKMENQLKETNDAIQKQNNIWLNFSEKMENVSKKMKDMGESLGKVGKSMSEYITLPIAGAVTGLVKLGMSFDDANDKIRIATGATGKALDDLQKDFEAVYGSVPTSMDEASTAISNLNTRLGLTGKPLQELSEKMILLSHETGVDLQSTIEQTSHAFEAFGIDAKNYGTSLDFVFKVSQSTGISVNDLLTTLQNSAPVLENMGLSFDSATALIGQLSKAGVNTEQVFTGLNKAIANMAKNGIKDADTAIATLFEKIKKAPNDMQATQIAVENFGTKTGVAIAKAVREGKLDMDAFLNTLKSSPETINKAAEDTEDFAEKFELLKNKLTLALEPLGNQLFNAINKLVPTITSLANSLVNVINWFAKLSPETQKFILILAGVLAGLGPILSTISKFMEVGSGVAKAVGGISEAFGKLGGVAGIVEKITPNLVQLKVGAQLTFDALKGGISTLGQALVSGFNVMKTAALGLGNVLKVVFTTMMANPWMIAVTAIIAGIILLITHWDEVKKIAQEVGKYISDKWNELKNALSNVVNEIVQYEIQRWNELKSTVSNIVNEIKTTVVNTWNNLKTSIENIVNIIKTTVLNAWNSLMTAIISVMNNIKNGVINAWNAIIDWIRSLPSTLYHLGVQMFEMMKNGIISTIGNIRNAIVNGLNSAIDYIRSLPSQAIRWGMDFINGLASGIRNAAYAVLNEVKSIAHTIASYLHFSRPDIGELRNYETWMPDFMAGLADGINRNKSVLISAVKGLSTDMAVTFNASTSSVPIPVQNTTNNTTHHYHYNISKLEFPNVTNGNDVIDALKKLPRMALAYNNQII